MRKDECSSAGCRVQDRVLVDSELELCIGIVNSFGVSRMRCWYRVTDLKTGGIERSSAHDADMFNSPVKNKKLV